MRQRKATIGSRDRFVIHQRVFRLPHFDRNQMNPPAAPLGLLTRYRHEFYDAAQRPMKILNEGKPIEELI